MTLNAETTRFKRRQVLERERLSHLPWERPAQAIELRAKLRRKAEEWRSQGPKLSEIKPILNINKSRKPAAWRD